MEKVWQLYILRLNKFIFVPSGAPLGLVVLVALAQASAGLAGSSEASQLPVLLHGRAHPVDLGVSRNCRVVDVNHYHLQTYH